MTFKTRFTTAIATGAVLVNALAPVALANTITVSGNGAFSNSAVNVSNNTTTVVNQTNDANITNHIDSNASTGGNTSNFNGGNTTIKTGNATTDVNVTSAVNLNQASLSTCGTCNGGATDVTISGNLPYSDNDVAVNSNNNVVLNQNNDANINNQINANASTGKNDSSYNVGDSVIWSGDASASVAVSNLANANIAQLGGNGSAGGSSVTISGNGAFSDNGVALNQNSAVVLDQNNDARIRNDVDANAKTGGNDSQFNTGGKTVVKTGNASNDVDVDNFVNFNSADLDCGCVLDDLDVTVAKNGADSWNTVDAAANNAVVDAQDNDAHLWNDVDGDAKTGANDVSFSTGDVNSDPMVKTGDANSSTGVNNSGNVNVLTNGNTLHLPGDWEVGTSFDLSGLWVLLHGWMA